MIGKIRRQISSTTEWLFPERQIILRSRGEVRYVALSRRTQIVLSTLLLGMAGWVGFSSIHMVYRNEVLAARDRRLDELASAYDKLALDFRASQDNFSTASRDLEQRYRLLHDLATQRGLLKNEPARNGKGATVGQAPEAAPPPGRAGSQTASVANDDAAQASRIIELENRLAGVRNTQRALLDSLTQRTQSGTVALEKALKVTGLDVALLMKQMREEQLDGARGGPLIAGQESRAALAKGSARAEPAKAEAGKAATPAGENKDQFDQGVAKLEQHMERWNTLIQIAQRLPLSRPVEGQIESSSGYGRRIDPFTRQWAFHSGVDILGQKNTPIVSTAPGVVVFAGRRGPYGQMVEIDHGFGVKTRYGHLSEIAVERGDIVAFMARIGTMGSTGRSTGTHLHYEVLFDDEPLDPINFFEAGNHVFKQQEAVSAIKQ